MGNKQDVQLWRNDAARALVRVTTAESRFTASLEASDVTMLAAADELQAATRDANSWLAANPSPDERVWSHVAWSLNALSEVACKAQRAVTDPAEDRATVTVQLRYLLTIFDFQSEMLDSG